MQNVDKLKNPINRKSGEEKGKKCGKKGAAVSGSSGQSLSDSELDRRGAEGIDERIPGFMHCMLGGSGSDSSDVSPVSSFQLDGASEARLLSPQFLLEAEAADPADLSSVTPETRARLEALLEAAGIGKSADSSRVLADPEVLRKLTSSVSSALDEAAAALTRMRSDSATDTTSQPSLVDACQHGNVPVVRRLLDEGSSVNETTEKGESLLALACHSGYYELAQVLLAMRANVEDRGMKGDCTPLMEAATAGHVEVVRLLIKHKADVNAQSSSGNTPLMYACSGGHVEVVRALLQAGANIEDANENGHTPLMEAASAGHVDVAQILLDHGAGINTHSNEFKESALTLACYKGHLAMVRFLLEAGADQEHKTEEMHTALMEASMDGHVEVARLLLDSGAQVNMPADSFESPLTLAACGGHVELALLLLDRGANIEEVNDEGYTPLMEAAREGHEEMVALLLSQEANINAITEETQETALTLACCGGFVEVADFLIQAGADVELGASTPLMEAAQEGHLELVKYLMERGANVNAVTQTGGDTALTYACENGHTAVAEVLLERGAALEHAAEGGRTALMKASRAGHLCTVTFLLSRLADVNRTTANNDHTALSLACHGGHLHVVKVLLQHGANPHHILKDNSTMLMEAAKNGHTQVVELLMDYPDIQPLTEAQMAGAFESAEAETVARLAAATAPAELALPGSAAAAMETPPYTPSSPVLGAPAACCVSSADLLESSLLALDGDEAGLGRATSDRLEQYLSEMLRRPDVSDQEGEEIEKLTNLTKTLASRMPEDLRRFQGLPGLVEASRESVIVSNPSPAAPAPPDQRPKAKPVSKKEQKKAPRQRELQAAQACGLQVAPPSGIQRQYQQLQAAAAYQAHLGLQPQQLQLLQSQLTMQGHAAAAAGVDKKVKKKPNNRGQPAAQVQPHALLVSAEPGAAAFGPPLAADDVAAHIQTNTGLMVAAPARTLNDTLYRPGPTDQAELTAEQAADWSRGYQLGTLHGLTGLHNCQPPLNLAYGAPAPAGQQPPAPAYPGGVPVSAVGGAPYPGQATADQLNSETESNHDTALTLACAGGHEELVQLLLKRGAHIEHRDKKGFTPLILAATAGHAGVVEILLANKADIEAQSERTKDTPLSLACSGGRYEVVDILLRHGGNKEHRNVSDYTPLSLAASGGYVNIIKLLLQNGAEINSRTGSKLGISPLMLAAMNGHTAAVKLLLEMGSDINAQIETNRNTALTLACFQGRHEVVQLLVDRRAYVEHRAKTGLTPLMEAASGGYVEVGRVLLDKYADVNAAPVPSSRDTALTIAADKGHYKFVELLVTRGAQAEVRNKKGNTPLWLAANGGHLDVVQLLYTAGANIDAQDNRKVSCLMAAYRRGHIKVVKWMVKHVSPFPSDHELTRFSRCVCPVPSQELAKKCQACVDIIRVAKERQAAEANRNATSLLEELAQEDAIQKQRQCLAAKKRDKKKKKRQSQTRQAKDEDESGDEDELIPGAAPAAEPEDRESPPGK
ncbi:ankyrin repeat and KH domain-containing protein 1-like [Pollicipes pollicipes]|uniref:ankyrin repeat and KH domain-containing protein 1-like n=1 Tax=Pollicipes pollicipes TaxID=41117 RepID=UPI001884F57F|nr:ankyrin repeat and KH domain-containing protein 1-like [Pollicipes pollicipes]